MRHLYICDFHKNFIQSVRNKRKRKTSDDGGDSPEHEADVPEVSSCQVAVDSLPVLYVMKFHLDIFSTAETTVKLL